MPADIVRRGQTHRALVIVDKTRRILIPEPGYQYQDISGADLKSTASDIPVCQVKRVKRHGVVVV
jgi:hypothetical protein